MLTLFLSLSLYIYIYASMCKLLPFKIINFSLNLLQVVSWALSVKKAANWRNSLLSRSGNGTLYNWRSSKSKFSEFRWQSEDWFMFMLIKSKTAVHIILFEVVRSDGDVMLSFILQDGSTFNKEALIKCLDRAGVCWKNLRLGIGLWAMPYKQGNAVLDVCNFLRLYYPLNLAALFSLVQ